jgi:tetratricopeptide (TPR) repeat protein
MGISTIMRALQWTMPVALLFALGAICFGQDHSSTVDSTSPANKSSAQQPQNPGFAVTISRETTYITEPLRKDGSVDYAAALDERFRQGVTPENNAAVLLWEAMGPGKITEDVRERYFQMLGMTPLPEKGDYFTNIQAYLARSKNGEKSEDNKFDSETEEEVLNILDQIKSRPWSKKEYPVIAEWLAANEKPLGLVIEASKRPLRYDPIAIYGEKTRIYGVPAFYYFGVSDIVEALLVRAMLRLNQGKVNEAWEDLLACHRLARLIGQGPMILEVFDASRIEARACHGDIILLENIHLSVSQATKMREDLARLPVMPKFADKVDIGERFSYLDTLSICSRTDIAGLAVLTKLKEYKSLEKTFNLMVYYKKDTPVDWDAVFRLGNVWFDKISEASCKPTRAEHKEAFKKLERDFSNHKKTVAGTDSLERSMSDNPRKALSERLGQVLFIILVSERIIYSYIPNEDENTMRLELDKLSFALAAYRADYGSYPEKLGDLAPKYIMEVSKDVCNDSQLHYRLEGDGLLLYSAGKNGRDDGGKSYDDRDYSKDIDEMVKNNEDYDDIVVRLPAQKANDKKPTSAKGSAQNLSADDSGLQDSLAKKIQQLVKDLEYSDKVAQDFSDMVMSWTRLNMGGGSVSLLSLNQNLGQARQDYEKHKLTAAEFAKIEAEMAEELNDLVNVRIFNKSDHHTLEDIVKDSEANCLGYSQLFYVLGTAIGLSVKAIWVEETFSDLPMQGNLHMACLVDLTDRNSIMVDLTSHCVSDPFVFSEQYSRVGNYWELQDKKNILGIHPTIQILDKNGIIAGIYYNKTIAYIQSGQYDKAVAGYTKAIELNPKLAEAFCNRAHAYIRTGQEVKAIIDCNKSIELNPKRPEAYQIRGASYSQLGRYKQAVADFSKAIEINPKGADAFLGRGDAYAKIGNMEEAEKNLLKAIELNPELKDKASAISKKYELDL